MSDQTNKTKKVLEEVLGELYKQRAQQKPQLSGSFLVSGNGQYLGKITENTYDNDSILNSYGPYGSRYSPTSIFNPYSEYGSRYGTYSINNPYSSFPPKLYISGRLKGYVTENQYLSPRIPSEAFLYTLENKIQLLIEGKVVKSETEVRRLNRESFIEAQDGTYLGSINPNVFDANSIFNQFTPYGSQFSPTSIFNQFGSYGSQFSQLSPYNPYSNTPPKVYVEGKFIGYLTKNSLIGTTRIDPDSILDWARNNVMMNLR